ncbi:unnamed protein product [Cochlearia groenlandica]
MVLRGEMTTATAARRPERPKSLHNFSLTELKWGNQRHLKCMKIGSTISGGGGEGGGGSGDHRLRRRSPPLRFDGYSVSIPFRFGDSDHNRRSDNNNNNNNQHRRRYESALNGGEEEGIGEFRVKIMSDLKTERDKITQSMFKQDDEDDEQEHGESSVQAKEKEISPAKPWNLRKRRAACKEPVTGNQLNLSSNQINKRSVAIEEQRISPEKERGGGGGGETKVRAKFALSLTKKEIEEDYMKLFGHRPPRRPKKRTRTVQKKLDSLCPGFYLTEVTLDAYKVPEDTKNMQR